MRLLFGFLTLLMSCTLSAEGTPCADESSLPVPFISILYARHPGSFYDQQAADWQAIATGDCSSDEAWWQYYKTAHYSNRFGSGSYDMEAIISAAEQALDPAGFELNYLYFAHDQDPMTRWPHLLKAHAADPTQMEAATGLAAYYAVTGDVAQRNAILARMHAQKAIPAGVMEYNYNQLMSVAPNGILITQGDADTYPSWLLQSAYGVRPDVSVINLPLLLGFENYQQHVKEVLGATALFATAPFDAAGLLDKLAEQSRPLFFATTGQPHLPNLPADRLFIAGLTFQYSLTPVNNLRMIATALKNTWRLDHLRHPLADDPAQAVADQLNQNYLPALLELHEYYQANPAPEAQQNLALIRSIAARAGREAEVSAYLRGPAIEPPLASPTPGLKAKEIMKGLTFIPAGLYRTRENKDGSSVNGFFMQEAEVSNADYQLFLEDLLRQRRFDLLDSVAVVPIDLKLLLPEVELDQPLNVGHPGYANHPIVNISHQAAELYALWLTQVHNQDPKRKDLRKVRFRLPTAMEFGYAFSGGKEFAPYPWGGPYFRNAKGCYLSNFNTALPVSEKDVFFDIPGTAPPMDPATRASVIAREGGDKDSCGYDGDGGVFTVPVRSYYPNDYGLYNMAGNAAEMINETGKSMGGSWYDPAYNMQRGVVTERTSPHPSTGFRLVMVYE